MIIKDTNHSHCDVDIHSVLVRSSGDKQVVSVNKKQIYTEKTQKQHVRTVTVNPSSGFIECSRLTFDHHSNIIVTDQTIPMVVMTDDRQ